MPGRTSHRGSKGKPRWQRLRRTLTKMKSETKSNERESRHSRDSRVKWDTRTGTFVTPRRGRRSILERMNSARMSLLLSGVWLLTLAGAAIRFAVLNHPMRYDESYNYLYFASKGPAYIATHYVPNNHILHTLQVWLASVMLGTTPAGLRLPALAAGVLLIPATAWLAWTLSRRVTITLLSTLAVCGSSALIEYSTNARGYSLLALVTLLATTVLLHALHHPTKRWLWLAWGLLGAIGLYTVPIMVLPMSAMGAFGLAWSLRPSPEPSNRKDIVRGLAQGAAVCALLSGLFYLPVLLAGGGAAFTESRRMAYDVLGRQIESPQAMLTEASLLWVRHVPLVGVAVLAFGLIAFISKAFRGALIEGWLPLALVGGAIVLAFTVGAPLPARAWLFALPVLLICAVQGACEATTDETGSVARRAIGATMTLVLIAIPAYSIVNVVQSPHLCSEPRGIVEVEDVLDECRTFGVEKCAMVSAYSPAIAYYTAQKGMPPLPLASESRVERVYIVADENRRLNELWHEGVEGFSAFGRPQTWRLQAASTIYVAERTDRSALR